MKVLVIGGTGWVGHHMALACSRAAAELNWIPEYSLESAVAETARFAKKEASR